MKKQLLRVLTHLLGLWLTAASVGADAPPLTLRQLLADLESHHPKLKAARLLPQLAAAKVKEKEGAFDPQLFLEQEWQRYQSPTAPGKPKFANDNLAAVQIQDLDGWKLTGGYRLNRNDVKSPDSLTGQGGEVFLELKMPLLRNRNINEKRTALEQANLAVKLAEATSRLIGLDLYLAASQAYWDWAAAASNERLLEKSWQLASERAAQVKVRCQSGDLAPIDGVEADQETLRRQESLLKARRETRKASLKLSLYRWTADWRAQEAPVLELAPYMLPSTLVGPLLGADPSQTCPAPQAPTPDLAKDWSLQALQQRPELFQMEFEKSIIAWDQKLAENDRQPALDLTLSPGLDMGYQSIGFTYKAGLQLTIPLGTRGPDGRLQAAQLKNTKVDLDQALETRRILTEVADAHSALDMSYRRYQAAQAALELALRLEQAERLKFQYGDSTLFLVNQRERATVVEAQKVIDTLLDYQRGLASSQAAQGRFEL